MRYKFILPLCFLLTLSPTLIAQPSPHFLEKLTTREGLSSNQVNDILQDDEGFLWIATTDGLNRFDGTETIHYYQRDSSNSIPHNYIYCLKKLSFGFMAIGTQGGLSFYNQHTGIFKNFYDNRNPALAEYNNAIIQLELDAKGNLWAVSRNCIFIFDRNLQLKTTILSPFTQADAVKQRLRFTEKILPLSNGDMLLYLYNGWHLYAAASHELRKLEGSGPKQQLGFINDMDTRRLAKKDDRYFPASNVFKIFSVYFLCIKPGVDSLLLLDEKGKQWSSCFFPYNHYPYISWSQQLAMIDSSRLLFLFHNFGLAEIHIRWQKHQPSIAGVSDVLFEAQEYITALRDRQNNWWLATSEDGLRKVSPYKQYFKNDVLIDEKSRQPFRYEMSSSSRYQNTLWIATYGNGFFKKDLASGRQQQFHLAFNANDPWPDLVWNIRQTSTDSLWLGTQSGLYWYCISKKKYGRLTSIPGKPAALDSVAITTQFNDSHGLVWMGLGKGKGLCYFDTKQKRFAYFPGNSLQGYPLRYPTHIAEDSKGNLWFTNDASTMLVHWTRTTQEFETVSLPSVMQKKISDLSGLWCESDSVIWLGTVASGLIRFNVAAASVKIYGHDKGIGDSHVSSIYQDRSKRLWLATRGSLSCFDQRKETFSNYTAKDGLPVEYPTASFFYDTIDHCLFTGGNGSVFCFDPDKMDPTQAPQKTIITAMEVNGKAHALDDQIKFSPSQNDITIHYTAIDLTNGPDTKYAYKLVGEDTGWVMAGKQRQINFSRLAPGDYTFMVRASNNNGTWSGSETMLMFHICKPFTQTVWFYGLILLIMGGLFYGMYRFRLRQLLRTEQMRSEISKNLHDEVGSTLTNISLGSLLAQKQLQNEPAVGRILERIYQDSQSVSQSMREIVWSIDPKIDTLGEALPRMLHYASELLEAKDMELQAEIAQGIEQVKLSMPQRRDLYLIFKEAVNNLAKHSGATEVQIQLHLVHNLFSMTISDNGIGFNTGGSFISNGLKNMQERAQRHRWQLNIKAHPGGGTRIELKARIA